MVATMLMLSAADNGFVGLDAEGNLLVQANTNKAVLVNKVDLVLEFQKLAARLSQVESLVQQQTKTIQEQSTQLEWQSMLLAQQNASINDLKAICLSLAIVTTVTTSTPTSSPTTPSISITPTTPSISITPTTPSISTTPTTPSTSTTPTTSTTPSTSTSTSSLTAKSILSTTTTSIYSPLIITGYCKYNSAIPSKLIGSAYAGEWFGQTGPCKCNSGNATDIGGAFNTYLYVLCIIYP